MDPPFKGEKWVEELEKVFDRLQEEWELKQLDAVTADPDGPYHARAGTVTLHLFPSCAGLRAPPPYPDVNARTHTRAHTIL